MNFNELLQNEINNIEIQNEPEAKICHITFEKLKDNYIVLDCKHTFNYDAIFKEICIQKTIINRKETQKLKKYCIKCPYCRFIQKGILPYRESYNLVPLVNTPKSKAFTMKKFQCKYIFASGKKKSTCCNKYSEIEYCNQHNKIIERRKHRDNTKKISKEPVNEITKPVNEITKPVNEITKPVNEITKPVNEITKPVNEITNPVNEITNPVNEIISYPINIVDSLENSIHPLLISEKWQKACEKKTTIHPIFNEKKETFNSCCSYVFKKGKLKGNTCVKFVNNTTLNGSPIYHKTNFCKTHSKEKYIIKPFFVPLFKDNLSQNKINKYYKDYINSQEYDYIENKGFYYKKECYLAIKSSIDNAKEKMNKIKKSTIIMI